jgi:hypothetical protein
VTSCAAVVAPTAVLANARLVGVKVTDVVAAPVPVSAAVCVPAESVKVSVAVSVPTP